MSPADRLAALAQARRFDLSVGLVLLALVAAYCWFSLQAPLVTLTFRSSDDAYYYFQVARNFVQGHGLTFDGLHPTNGFHPLWMLLLIPVYSVTGGAGELSLRLAFCLVAVVAGGAVWMAYVCLREYAGRVAAAVGALALLTPPFLNPLLNGLETGLMLLLLFALLWSARRFRLLAPNAGSGKDVALGLLLGLILLARLDTIFLVLCVYAVPLVLWAQRHEGRPPVAKLAIVGLVTSAVVAPYFVWNQAQFGHFVPLSGALKTSFPEITFTPRRFGGYHAHYGQAQLLFSTAVLAWLARARSRRGAGTAHPVVVAAWAGCLLHMLNTLLFMDFGVHWWHFASYAPVTVLLGAVAFEEARMRFPRPAVVTAVALACLLMTIAAGQAIDFSRRGTDHERWFEAALWAKDHLPADAVVGMTDCGLFGYFSERRTVNLDGVINGYEYQDALSQRRLSSFLRSCRMTHVACHAARYERGKYVVWLPARLTHEAGGAIVGQASAEVYRSPPYDGAVFAIWDLRHLPVIDDASDPWAIKRSLGIAQH